MERRYQAFDQAPWLSVPTPTGGSVPRDALDVYRTAKEQGALDGIATPDLIVTANAAKQTEKWEEVVEICEILLRRGDNRRLELTCAVLVHALKMLGRYEEALKRCEDGIQAAGSSQTSMEIVRQLRSCRGSLRGILGGRIGRIRR